MSGTAQIAASISGKVRTLDLAQSRVAETLSNIKAVLDRTNCINGVQAAMEAAVGQREGAYGYREAMWAVGPVRV